MDENHTKYKKMIKDTDQKLKNLMAKWVLRYDYFGFLFSLIRRRAEVGLLHPAAIAPTTRGTLELLYNPILIAGTQDEDLNEILHHEGLHILNKHISRMMRILADLPKEQHKQHIKIINIACDCCVNEQGKIKNPLIIAGTPFRLHFPKDIGLKPDRMMEEYYYTLLNRERQKEKQDQDNDGEKGEKGGKGDKPNDKTEDDSPPDNNDDKNDDKNDNDKSESKENPNGEENPEDANGNGQPSEEDGKFNPDEGNRHPNGKTPDDPNQGKGQGSDNSDLGNHQQWISDEVVDPHATSRQIDTYTQRMIRESAKNFQRSKSRGKMPGYIQDLIDLALKPVPIPYYELIRQLVKGSRIGKYKRSSTHINRKRTYVFQLDDSNIPMISPFPGRKRDLSFKIGVIVDTSGSQQPEDIIDALSGCKHIIEKDRHCETTILEVDTKIHKEYKIKCVSDIDFDVKGRGGTILMPGLERCRELNVDVCMCFTDGYTENFNEIDRRLFPKRMIWVITPGGSEDKLNHTGYVVHLPERNN